MNVIVPNAFPDFFTLDARGERYHRYDKYKDFADKLIAEADVIAVWISMPCRVLMPWRMLLLRQRT